MTDLAWKLAQLAAMIASGIEANPTESYQMPDGDDWTEYVVRRSIKLAERILDEVGAYDPVERPEPTTRTSAGEPAR